MLDFEAARRNMVDSQIRPNDVTDPAIVRAFLQVPREVFVPNSYRSVAYSEQEIPTSPSRSLWTPRDTAKLIKLAAIQPDDIVLVVGAGAGYEAALISRMADTVIALEEHAALADAMSERFARLGIDSAAAVTGKLVDGLPSQAPFDVIYVCGMIDAIPDAWACQLKEAGRIAAVIAEDSRMGRGSLFTYVGGVLSSRTAFDACPPRLHEFDRKPSFSF
jgi:protein-L-isoaspartate(D-aspartate) O-methyltransferase